MVPGPLAAPGGLRAHHRRRSAVLSVPDPPGLRPWYRRRPGPRRAFSATWRPSGPTSPRCPGLDKPESLVLGCRSFALSRGCRLQGQVLEIPAQREARPSLDQCRQFVAQCLDQDCPVAFLNFSHGALKNLDSWHWVPLTAMTEGESVLLCTILDEGGARVIDLALWWETSSLGGALVGLFPDMESDQTDG
ncbi:MAG: hypothetical protein ACLR53_05375 [Evtepia gabavorous]